MAEFKIAGFDATIGVQQIIDVDSAEAFLVRKDGDAGDVLAIDTVNGIVLISALLNISTTEDSNGGLNILAADDSNELRLSIHEIGIASAALQMQQATGTLQILDTAGDIVAVFDNDTKSFRTAETRALDANGLKLFEDSGLGIFIKDGGNVGVNTLTPDTVFSVKNTGDTAMKVFGDDFVALAIESYRTSDSDKALVNLYSSRGTQAVPLSVLSNDPVGGIVFRGKRNTDTGMEGFGIAAKIEAIAEEDFTNTNHGAKISFQTVKLGTTVLSERAKINGEGHFIQQEVTANPVVGDLSSDAAIAIYNKSDKLVFAYNNGGTVTYITLALDGSAVTWVHSTSAP